MLGPGCLAAPSWYSAHAPPATAPGPVLCKMLRGEVSPDKGQGPCSSLDMHILLGAQNGPWN